MDCVRRIFTKPFRITRKRSTEETSSKQVPNAVQCGNVAKASRAHERVAKNLGKIYFHGKSGIRPNKRLGLHYFAIAEPVREFKAMEKRIMKKKEGAQGSCMRSKH